MTKIGIIGAMGSEVELLKTRLTDCQETVAAGRHFYSGKIGSVPVVLVCSGIGKVNSAVTCQLLIDLFKVTAVIKYRRCRWRRQGDCTGCCGLNRCGLP